MRFELEWALAVAVGARSLSEPPVVLDHCSVLIVVPQIACLLKPVT